jgi:hypothetical protein
MERPNDDEPKVWVTVVKLIIGVVVIVGGVGLALWYAKDMDNGAPKLPATDVWGISKDSPINMRR